MTIILYVHNIIIHKFKKWTLNQYLTIKVVKLVFYHKKCNIYLEYQFESKSSKLANSTDVHYIVTVTIGVAQYAESFAPQRVELVGNGGSTGQIPCHANFSPAGATTWCRVTSEVDIQFDNCYVNWNNNGGADRLDLTMVSSLPYLILCIFFEFNF